jgi:hypothetical protein
MTYKKITVAQTIPCDTAPFSYTDTNVLDKISAPILKEEL